jgi:hypothetical protein
MPPTDDSINSNRHHYQSNQTVKDLRAILTDPVSQTVHEQHCGVAKPIVFQFASAFLIVLSQGISSCKNAQ